MDQRIYIPRHNKAMPTMTILEATLLSRRAEGRPFSCRMYRRARRGYNEVTVLGVIMGTPTEDPILRTIPCEQYFERYAHLMGETK